MGPRSAAILLMLVTLSGLTRAARAQQAVVNFGTCTVGKCYGRSGTPGVTDIAPPGKVICTEAKIPAAIVEFLDPNDVTVFGTCKVNRHKANNYMSMSNSCLNFDMSSLDFEPRMVTLIVEKHAQGLNLTINGSVNIYYREFSNLPSSIKKVKIQHGPGPGTATRITLTGYIETLVVGGCEFDIHEIRAEPH